MNVRPREAKLLPQVRQFLAEPKRLLIGGRWVESASGETFETLDPSTEDVLSEVPEAGTEDIDGAVSAAREAFEDGRWSGLEPSARAGVLHKIGDAIESSKQMLAQLETLDSGKPVEQSVFETEHVASVFHHYAGWCDKVYGETNPTGPDRFIYTLREPVGVCAQIIPWNFPLVMAAWKVAPALAFGNTTVLKPAEETPLTALALGKIALECGVPDGVLNILTGHGETTGARLVAHPGIDKIAFTGSTEVGRKIMAAAAPALARLTLELGGKSPNVIFADANLDQAVSGAAFGIFFNAGQVCVAGSRLLVQRQVHDEVVDQLARVAAGWTVGDGFAADSKVGPLVSRTQLDRVQGYFEAGPSEGALLRTGGKRIGDRGYFVEPTIFTEVKPDMRIAREEIFGPVISVIPFADPEDAIRMANDTMYGLAAGVWTTDVGIAHRMARGIRAGTVWVNDYGPTDPSVSFGGYKHSGFGRELGVHSIESYTQTKTVWMKLSD